MKLTEFIAKYNGKGIDYDNAYGTQCVDLFNQYLVDVFGITQPIQLFPVASAFQLWEKASKTDLFEKIPNDPYAIPRPGDIIVWKKTPNLPHGHVAIFVSGDVMKFESFDQNWPLGSVCGIVKHNYNDVVGWLRYKGPTSIVEPIKLPQISLPNLDGNKTYIAVGIMVLIIIAHQMGYINDETFNLLDTIFLAFLGFSLRDAIKKK